MSAKTEQTTLEFYAGKRRANYCTNPTIDVAILPDEWECKHCDHGIDYAPILGRWVHLEQPVEDEAQHVAKPTERCEYCHATETLTYTAHAYYDAVTCTRCGGVTGFSIGD